MLRYDFRCLTCDTITECVRSHKEIYAPTCESCGAPPGGMKRVYSTVSGFHRKPDPNFEKDRARRSFMVKNGYTPISKRETDMLEHNVNRIQKREKENRLRGWEKAVDNTMRKVGGVAFES